MEIEIRPGPRGLEGGQPWPAVAEMMKNGRRLTTLMNVIRHFMPRSMLVRTIRSNMGSPNKDIARTKLITGRFEVNSPNGSVTVWSYRPEGTAEGLPVFVYFHGGGWLGGSVEVVENVCRAIVDRAHCVALNVDYRLAPEHPFPEGLEDCRAVAEWSVVHAKEIGGDPSQVVLAGDSSGGNLATVCTLLAKEAGRSVYRGRS
jgi:acetyl esterase